MSLGPPDQAWLTILVPGSCLIFFLSRIGVALRADRPLGVTMFRRILRFLVSASRNAVDIYDELWLFCHNCILLVTACHRSTRNLHATSMQSAQLFPQEIRKEVQAPHGMVGKLCMEHGSTRGSKKE